jgi:putative transposase
MDEAKVEIEAWRVDYNVSRPHEALKDLTPSEYASKCRAIETTEVSQQAEN